VNYARDSGAQSPELLVAISFPFFIAGHAVVLCSAVIAGVVCATVGSLLTAVPWLVSLSHHKNWVFTVAGVLIGANVLYVHVVAPRLRVSTLTCEQRDDSCTRAAPFQHCRSVDFGRDLRYRVFRGLCAGADSYVARQIGLGPRAASRSGALH